MGNAKEAGFDDSNPFSNQQELPPPYTPGNGPPPAQAAASSTPSASTSTSTAPPPQQSQPQPPHFSFPESWNLYQVGTFGATLLIAENQDRPLYAVTQHSGWSGSPDVVLHCGPDKNLPALASAERASSMSSMGPARIVLPALNPYPQDGGAMNGGGMAVVTEDLIPLSGWTRSFEFTIEVGHPPNIVRETFEWRHSRGDAVAILDGASYGYKLVRESMQPPPGVAPGTQFVGGGYMSSDGQEVVAVCARSYGSMSKRMKFRFLGTGASGLLGERWRLMAAVSSIRIWQQEQRARRANN